MVKKTVEPMPAYGRGFARMKARLGPERTEALRQQVLKDQLEARAKWGVQPVTPRDREEYKEYPVTVATAKVRPKTGGYSATVPRRKK